MRRHIQPDVVVALVALVAVAGLAGCGGGGQRTPEPIVANASKATVGGEATADVGYQERTVTREAFDDTGRISVSGDVQLEVEYLLRGTAWRAVYTKPEPAPPAVFVVYSVPKVKPENVAVTVNPLRDVPPGELAARVQDQYTEVSNVQHVRNRTTTVLGNETTVQTFAATATADGEPVDVSLHVAMTPHGDDVVVGVGVHPRGRDEGRNVRRLLQGIEH